MELLTRVTYGIGDSHPPVAGLYWSPTDTPAAMTDMAGLRLTEQGDGWVWEGNDGSTGYLQRIEENWFYFEGK